MPDNLGLSLETLGINAPFSAEAEQAVLGAIITDSNATLSEVMSVLTADCFYQKYNSAIYREIILMFTAGRPVDYVTVLDAVVKAGIFEKDDDAKVYLFSITQSVPTIKNVVSYAKIVYDKFLLRSLINASREIIDNARDGQDSASTLLDFAEQRIYDIRNGRNSSELDPLEDIIIRTLQHLEELSGPDRDKLRGLNTGFKHLDETLTGLNKSDLIVLAARPGVGKTSFALNVISNIAKKYECSVALFSLEMTKMQLAERLISAESGVSSYSFRTGEFKDDDWTRIADASTSLSGARIFIDDTPGVSVTEIKAKARRLPNLGLIVVDYLQLMGGSSSRGDSRNQEISDITRAFKILAKELNVPVILLSQLSRAGEKQQQRRPLLSDLRDSGSIEQDADIVLFLHRDKPEDENADQQEYLSEVLLIVAKNRHGEVNTLKLHWNGKLTQFTSMEYLHDD